MFEIATVIVTPFQQNARIIACNETQKAVVVDPGGDADLINQALERRSLTLEQIWLTHSHLDHCGGVKALLENHSGVSLVGTEVEEPMRQKVLEICQMYGLPSEGMENCPEPDTFIDEGDTVSLASYDFKVLYTPGHSPGHVCFYHRDSNTLIAGDTLFAGSIGRTDLPGGDYQTLLLSIKQKILSLPDETVVMSGHGPDTTVGVERRGNPFIMGL
jgi:glyoxylase-like metal-dependent hydrolase (beta-lactamase superfamily II)